MGGTADDFQACGDLVAAIPGDQPPLFKAYDDKIAITHEQSNLTSNLTKAGVITLEGDLSQAPSTIPGSRGSHTMTSVGGRERWRYRVTLALHLTRLSSVSLLELKATGCSTATLCARSVLTLQT